MGGLLTAWLKTNFVIVWACGSSSRMCDFNFNLNRGTCRINGWHVHEYETGVQRDVALQTQVFILRFIWIYIAKFSATRSFQKDHGEAFLSKLGRASLCRIDAANATFQSWRHLTSQRSMRKSGVSFCSTVWHRCRISWAWRCFWDALFAASYIPKESWTGRHLEAACWKTRFRSALFGFYIHKESWKGYTISKPHVEKHVFGVPFEAWSIPKESWKGHPILKPHVGRHVSGVPFLKPFTSPKKAEKGAPSRSHMLKDMFLRCPFWGLEHPQRKLQRAPHLEATCWKTCFWGALFEVF